MKNEPIISTTESGSGVAVSKNLIDCNTKTIYLENTKEFILNALELINGRLQVFGEVDNVDIENCTLKNFTLDLSNLKMNKIKCHKNYFDSKSMMIEPENGQYEYSGYANIFESEEDADIPEWIVYGIDENSITKSFKFEELCDLNCFVENSRFYIFDKTGKYVVHHKDGPAIINRTGLREWRQNGMLHRTDGFAVEDINSPERNEYALCGHIMDIREFEHYNSKYDFSTENGKLSIFKKGTNELHCDEWPAVHMANGTTYWYRHGKLHRADGPAIVRDFEKKWAKNGMFHREDGPAIERTNGDKIWMYNDKLHRIDGPAVISGTDTQKEYWLSGEQFSKEEHDYIVRTTQVISAALGAKLTQTTMSQDSKDRTEITTKAIQDIIDSLNLSSGAAPTAPADADTDTHNLSAQNTESEWVLPGLAILAAGLIGAMRSNKSKNEQKITAKIGEHKCVKSIL